MNYISTRNKSLNFDFSSIFLRGLAPDGGLFLPDKIQKFSEKDFKELSKLNYVDLGVEIISKFCAPLLSKTKISSLFIYPTPGISKGRVFSKASKYF